MVVGKSFLGEETMVLLPGWDNVRRNAQLGQRFSFFLFFSIKYSVCRLDLKIASGG